MQSIGQYTLGEELGRGAMGVVFRGFDTAIGRSVAIKLIHVNQFASAADQAEAKLRFAREASAAGRLSHPNIVTVYQFGEQEDLEYLVQELVEGRSLEKLLVEAKIQDPRVVISLLRQIADALDYAHGEGIVHRDVKPANILVRTDGKAKITDFGIARISSQAVTRTGFSMGTLAYMAPEQIMTAKVGGQADQFSLAVVAFQMLCGQKPFVAETDPALIFKIVSEQPPRLDQVNRSFPASVSEVLLRAMTKDPEQRFATCAEFVQALEGSFAGTSPIATPTGSVKAPETQPRPRSGVGKYAAAAGGVVALAAGIWGFSTLRLKNQSSPQPPSSPLAAVVNEPPRATAAVNDIHQEPQPSLKPPAQAPTASGAAPPSGKAAKPEAASIDVAGDVEASMLVRQVAPEYPALAEASGLEGMVRFTAGIGKDGRVYKLGLVSGDPLLAEAARKAVEQWTYKPTLVKGKPVAVDTQIDVKFERPSDRAAYQVLLDKGEQQLAQGSGDEAFEAGQKALRLDPTRWESYDLMSRSVAKRRDAASLGYAIIGRALAPRSMLPEINRRMHAAEARMRLKGQDKEYEVSGKLTAINMESGEITVTSSARRSYALKLFARTPILAVKRNDPDPPAVTKRGLNSLREGDRVTVGIGPELHVFAVIVHGALATQGGSTH